MYEHLLGIAANWAATLTSIVVVSAYFYYRYERRTKRLRLEDYLKAKKTEKSDKQQHTVKHLVARLSMTEHDVMDAAFRSKNIRCVIKSDSDGLADTLLFEYVEISSC